MRPSSAITTTRRRLASGLVLAAGLASLSTGLSSLAGASTSTYAAAVAAAEHREEQHANATTKIHCSAPATPPRGATTAQVTCTYSHLVASTWQHKPWDFVVLELTKQPSGAWVQTARLLGE